MTVVSNLDDIHGAAGAFLDAAFPVLASDHLIPPSRYHPHLEVGRDYEGTSVMFLAEFKALEAVLDKAFPGRFADPMTREHADFSSHWIYRLLAASIARCSQAGEAFVSSSPAVDATIAELITELSKPNVDTICCRAVPHLATPDGAPVQICGIEVLPDTDGRKAIPSLIPGGASAFNRDPPFVYDPPQALLVARGTGRDPVTTGSVLSAKLDKFLLALRLLYATTAWTAYEVQGQSSLLQPNGPLLTTSFRDHSMVRRTLQMTLQHEPPVNALIRMLDASNRGDARLVFSSFGLALSRFNDSYQTGAWDEQVLGLTTAMEAAISGTATTDIILRLKIRSAALLASEHENALAIFDDIGNLYSLRSSLIHGGTLTMTKFMKIVHKVSTVPAEAPPGVAVGYMVDRLRDLVRRLILARLCLASSGLGLWPLGNDEGVDANLAEDATKESWRSGWRGALDGMGSAGSADPAAAALDFLSREDR